MADAENGSGAGPTTTAEERAEAAAMREGSAGGANGGGGSSLFETIAGAEIDTDARQKYVLIQLKKEGSERYLVRGRRLAAYHKDAADPTLELLRKSDEAGLSFRVLGGGRITHESEKRLIQVFGHSYGFPWEGPFRHDLSAQVLREAFPGYEVVTSDEGY